jgi:hypothetical protein
MRPQICFSHTKASVNCMPRTSCYCLHTFACSWECGPTVGVAGEYLCVSRWSIVDWKCSRMLTHSSQLAIVAISPFHYAAEANLLIWKDVSSPYWSASSFFGILNPVFMWVVQEGSEVLSLSFYRLGNEIIRKMKWNRIGISYRNLRVIWMGNLMVAISHKISFHRQS